MLRGPRRTRRPTKNVWFPGATAQDTWSVSEFSGTVEVPNFPDKFAMGTQVTLPGGAYSNQTMTQENTGDSIVLNPLANIGTHSPQTGLITFMDGAVWTPAQPLPENKGFETCKAHDIILDPGSYTSASLLAQIQAKTPVTISLTPTIILLLGQRWRLESCGALSEGTFRLRTLPLFPTANSASRLTQPFGF